jgi:hypothetical protein
VRELDKIRKPYAASNAISNALIIGLLEFWVPDPKNDDEIIENEVDFEPIASLSDNCVSLNKMT